MLYEFWHMNPYMMNSRMMHYPRPKPYEIKHHPPREGSSAHPGTIHTSNNENELKPDFEAIISSAFEMYNIQDSDLKKALTKALEQTIDYDRIYNFVQEKMKLHRRNYTSPDISILPHPSPSSPEGLESPKHGD